MDRTDSEKNLNAPSIGAQRFYRFAIFNLVYTVAVILWGAFVRATGSGAGCGEHWPLCNGEVLPRPERIQTVIEFAHRTTSGVNLLLVVAAWVWARHVAPAGSKLRQATLLAVIAIFMEAILGAGLVLLRYVEFDQSVGRAVSISLHLVNTLFLVSTLVTTVYVANPRKAERLKSPTLYPREKFFGWTLGAFVLLAMMGAVAALGDTLFPAQSMLHGWQQDADPQAHFLVRLRVIHPLLAVAWVVLVTWWSKHFETFQEMGIRNALLGTVLAQFLLGILNWVLRAPTWMQILHLCLAELTFIVFWWSGLAYETRKSRHSS
jgi:cytochrome c oxidase assembly protein subunit 15